MADREPERSGNPFIIAPPPPGSPASAAPPVVEPEPPAAEPASFIELPPGVVDSATFKVEPTRVVRPPREQDGAPQRTERSNDEITFFPTPIGAPAVPPTEVPEAAAPTESPEAASPVDTAWVLTLPDGIELTLDTGRLLVGRNPTLPEGARSDVRLVSVTDPAKSVSKTHAEFELRDGVLFVTDLGSTNGIAIGTAGQEDELVTPSEQTAVASGRIVALGTFEIVVARR